MIEFNKCVGRVVESIAFSNDNWDLDVNFKDGTKLELKLEGDCCSSSYFTEDAVEDAWELVGSTIVSIEDRDDGHNKDREYKDTDDFTSTIWSFLVFKTNKGHVTLDWRNDSNGYYSGWVKAEFKEAVN
jgi:hypothetical protein